MRGQSIITNMPGNSNISGSVKDYLEKIIDDDKKIWVNDLYTELRAKEIIPVSLRLVERKEHKQTIFDVSKLVAKESKLIISGGSGSGKTITLKWLNVIYANRCLKDEKSKIPVYIALNLYNKGTFYEYARKNVKNNGLLDSKFDSLLNDNKLIFLIDGLDLLSSSDQFNPYSEISDFISDHNDCRYVVSSRPGFFGKFERFTVSQLEGLNVEKIGLFIDKYAPDKKICEPLKNKILSDEKLKSLFSNPLMLYLAIKVASRQKNEEILLSKSSQMYMEFIDGLFEHDSSKMPQAYRLHSNKQQILETLIDIYFYMQCKNEVSMDYSDALEIASKNSEDKRYEYVSASSILEDIFIVGLIPKNNSVITYGIHQSFQEYFSALKLKIYFEKGFDISEAFRHPKWEEVVLFASEMFDCPDEFIRSMIYANELHLASKCAQNTGQEIKEEICFLLADLFDKSRHPSEKNALIESIQRFGDIGIIVIIQALHDEDTEVREYAPWVLGKIKSDKGLNALKNVLKDKDSDLRWNEINALSEIKNDKSIDASIEALKDKDPDVRWKAVNELRGMKSDKIVDALIPALHDDDANVRMSATWVLLELSEICIVRHKELLKNISLNHKNEDAANNAFEIFKEIELNEKSRAELFQTEPVPRTESPSPSISTAQQPETGAIDPYFHIPVIEISKIRKPTVIVDYGCGYGKLLTPMKNLGADVLNNIHYIGVDAKTACLLKSNWTAEKYGLFKNEPEFMTPKVFFKKDITVDFALLMHTLHEIRLVDLVDSIYHITAKLPVGGQIFILEPGSFIEERNYVLWKDTDFKMIFSNHGFYVMPYPITTNKGHKLNAVNILKIQNENISKDTVAEKCLLMFEAKKKELIRMLNNNPTGSEKDKEIDLLYSYVSRQIDEYKAI